MVAQGAPQGGRDARARAADGVHGGLGVAAERRAGGGGEGGEVGVAQERVEPGLDLVAPAGRSAVVNGERGQRDAVGGAERVGRAGAPGGLGRRTGSGGIAELDGARRQGAEGQRAVRALGDRAERLDGAGARLLAYGAEDAGEPLGAAGERRRATHRFQRGDHAGVIRRGRRGTHAEQSLVGRARRSDVGEPRGVLADRRGGGERAVGEHLLRGLREGGQLGQVGDPHLGHGGGGAVVGVGRGEGLGEALDVGARIAGHQPERLLHPLLRAVVVGEAEARDLRAEERTVAPGLGAEAGAGLDVEHRLHGAPVAVARDQPSHLPVGERRRRGEPLDLLRDGASDRLLAGHGVELGHDEQPARAGGGVLVRLGLGAEPLRAGDPGVALLLAQEQGAGVLLAIEGDGGRLPRGHRERGGPGGRGPRFRCLLRSGGRRGRLGGGLVVRSSVVRRHGQMDVHGLGVGRRIRRLRRLFLAPGRGREQIVLSVRAGGTVRESFRRSLRRRRRDDVSRAGRGNRRLGLGGGGHGRGRRGCGERDRGLPIVARVVEEHVEERVALGLVRRGGARDGRGRVGAFAGEHLLEAPLGFAGALGLGDELVRDASHHRRLVVAVVVQEATGRRHGGLLGGPRRVFVVDVVLVVRAHRTPMPSVLRSSR